MKISTELPICLIYAGAGLSRLLQHAKDCVENKLAK